MKQPVIAAIPNFNMGAHLVHLLPELLAEEFDHIYILDDASTDDSVTLLEPFVSPRVTVVKGTQNRSAGPNRNRILPYLKGNELIFFLDADMELVDRPLVPAIRAVMQDPKRGVVGFKIVKTNDAPYEWNFSGEVSVLKNSNVILVNQLQKRFTGPRMRRIITVLNWPVRYHWTFNRPHLPEQRVTQVAEGAFVVRASLFKATGGFDEVLPHSESLDLARHARARGLEVWFSPALTLRHLKIEVRGGSRRRRQYLAAAYHLRRKRLLKAYRPQSQNPR